MAKTEQAFNKRIEQIKKDVRYKGQLSYIQILTLWKMYQTYKVEEFTKRATLYIRRLKAER